MMIRIIKQEISNVHHVYYTGAISIPGAGGGMVFGGFMVKKLKLRLRGIIYFCCVCMCFAAVLAPSFLMTCPSQPVAGISTSYRLQVLTS